MTKEEISINQSWTVEQRIELGTMAEQAARIFNIIVSVQKARYLREWEACDEAHSKTMAALKSKHMMLVDFIGIYDAVVQDGRRLVDEKHDKNSQEYKEQQRLDTQGFGLDFDKGAD